MNELYVPLGLSALALTWFLTQRKRKLPTTEELLSRLHPDSLKGLDDFLPHNPIKDLLDSDKEFWIISGGYNGLLLRCENAGQFVRLCQGLERDHGMPRRAVRRVSRKAFWVKFFSAASLPEGLIRIFFKNMPHICARVATFLYWEMSNLADALNVQFGTENWISHA